MNIDLNSKEIKDMVIDSLKNKVGFSMIRIGDGEIILANNVIDKISSFSLKQIGREMNYDELLYTQIGMKLSVINCDVLGLPSEKHIKKSKLWSDIFEYYNNIFSENQNDWIIKKYCSINSHFDLLNSGDLFDIFRSVDKIVIVSPRDITERLRSRFPNIKEIEYYHVPGEQKYEIDKNKNLKIFEILKNISYEIKSIDRSGQLLIFGVGPFGKKLGYDFKSVNGVSLDIGSVFDLFVGKVTRGQGKGANSKINPLL